jgi:hypothetical protein
MTGATNCGRDKFLNEGLLGREPSGAHKSNRPGHGKKAQSCGRGDRLYGGRWASSPLMDLLCVTLTTGKWRVTNIIRTIASRSRQLWLQDGLSGAIYPDIIRKASYFQT